MTKHDGFMAGRGGVIFCRICGKRTRNGHFNDNTSLCKKCFDDLMTVVERMKEMIEKTVERKKEMIEKT